MTTPELQTTTNGTRRNNTALYLHGFHSPIFIVNVFYPGCLQAAQKEFTQPCLPLGSTAYVLGVPFQRVSIAEVASMCVFSPKHFLAQSDLPTTHLGI